MPKATPLLSLPSAEPIKVKDLDFDPENPRLREAGVPADAGQLDIAEALWTHLQAEEIAMSIIAAKVFFPHEPLMVESSGNGRYVVIEGNRRLVAVRAIIDKRFRKTIGAEGFEDFKESTPELEERLKELPCIVTTREKLWQFIGFKHVNGPKPWSAISKAEFIADVHENRKVGLSEVARQIGDRHQTVKRLYQGWCVHRQANDSGVFDWEKRFSKRYAFSHLYTILEYPNTRRFLGLTTEPDYEDRKPVPKTHLEQLGNLCLWLFGRGGTENQKPLVESQNPDLRDLDLALGKRAGEKALIAGLTLQAARDASLGNKRLFDDAMQRAVLSLKDANAVCAVGAEGNREEHEIATQAYKLSGAVLDEIERKQKRERTRG
jgi:hypothetical protein